MKPTYPILLLAVLLTSCAPLTKVSNTKIDIPYLGAIGKENGNFVAKNFQQVGHPVVTDPIALSVREIPFTKATFKDYKNLKERQGEKTIVVYADSLPEKPRYVLLDIQDKIGLMALLNRSENDGVRSYLTKDSQCKIVSNLSFYMHPMTASVLLDAAHVFLNTDRDGQLQIEAVYGKEKRVVSLPQGDIFAYELMGFCWGEDVYGNARIETLNDHGSCPEGTEKSAQKLEDTKSYLKL